MKTVNAGIDISKIPPVNATIKLIAHDNVYSIDVKIKRNNCHHQYSERLARPLKSTYFLRHVLIDVMKSIIYIDLSVILQYILEFKKRSPGTSLFKFKDIGLLFYRYRTIFIFLWHTFFSAKEEVNIYPADERNKID